MDDPIYSGRQLTFEEYLELERSSEIRHEFYHGELFAMSGRTKKHNRIVRYIARLVEDRFLSQGCRVYSENVKLEVMVGEVPSMYGFISFSRERKACLI